MAQGCYRMAPAVSPHMVGGLDQGAAQISALCPNDTQDPSRRAGLAGRGCAMSSGNNSPMLKAAGLWAKSSTKGGQYLTGRLGGVKVLILENRDRQTDDDPSHHLFFAEAPDRRQDAGERPQE